MWNEVRLRVRSVLRFENCARVHADSCTLAESELYFYFINISRVYFFIYHKKARAEFYNGHIFVWNNIDDAYRIVEIPKNKTNNGLDDFTTGQSFADSENWCAPTDYSGTYFGVFKTILFSTPNVRIVDRRANGFFEKFETFHVSTTCDTRNIRVSCRFVSIAAPLARTQKSLWVSSLPAYATRTCYIACAYNAY